MGASVARLPAVLLAVVLSAATVYGQAGAAGLTGIVRDGSGAAIPGATVEIRDVRTGLTRVAATTRSGLYAFAGLPPAAYQLAVSLTGFHEARGTVRLRTGETARLDVNLVPEGLAESVTVTAAAPILRAETAGLGQVVGGGQIVDLPLNGRSFVSLAALAPGVALPPGSQLPRINGGRPRTNEYLFDGISVLQPEPGQVAFFPVVDAIREFKIESNSPPAEFGRFNGGVINLTTKAGTNSVHGDGFEFLRNEALNARNFFAPAGAARPAFRRNQVGGTVGGPVRRDRTFFFADLQAQRQRVGRTLISTVPTILQRQGVFTEAIGGLVPAIYDPATTRAAPDGGFVRSAFPGNAIPPDRMDPVARALLDRFPLPTSPGTANNYRRTGNEIDDQEQVDVRVDQRFGESDRAFARVSRFHDAFVPVTPLPDGSGRTSGTLGPQRTTAWALASSYQRVFSDRWLNELRAGDTRRSVGRSAATLAATASESLHLPALPAGAQFPNTLPTFLIAGYQGLGSPPNTAADFSTGVTQIVDALTWIRGRHTVKAGADLRWERLDVIQPPSPTGSFTFTSLFTDLPGHAGTGAALAGFLLGQVQTFSIDLQQEPIENRAHVQEYFVQDDWKISDRVTVNAGVRYTLNFPSTEVHDQAAVFNLETQRLDYLGRDGHPRAARELHRLNFGPRLGLVVRPTDRTVLSSGYALVWIEQAGITTPFTTPVFPFLQTVSQRSQDNVSPAFVLADGPSIEPIPLTPGAGLGQGVFAVDRALGSGYAQQWNASWQRQLTRRLALEIAYVGSHIVHVGIPDSNLNQLSSSQLALGPALLQRVPNPYFGTIPRSSSLGDPTIPVAQLLKPYPEYTTVSLYRNNVGTTSYQGLEARLEQRLSRGLSYLVSYTRSKLIDDASAVFDASILTGPVADYPVANSFDRQRERDYSTGDIPHVLTASLVWAPSGAWTITALMRLQSGTPIAITQATNFNAFAGYGVQRPDLTGDPELPAAERSVSRWFDTDAFRVAAPFTIGSASRNPVRGPGYRAVDLAIVRRLPVAARVSLDVRAEIFNLLNTPAFGAPNGVLGSPGFGSITTAGDPRVAQLALKVIF